MDVKRLAELLAELLTRTGPAAPLLLFLAAFIEYLFPPFPGDLLVVLGAWYATHGALSWPLTFAAVTAGAVLGAAVDWRVGRWLGARLGERAAAGRLDSTQVARFEAAYRRWGGLLLVANRFLPGIRAFFFVAAGASGIPLWKVLLFGGVSAAIWNGLLLAAGAFLARNQEELVDLVGRYNTAAMALLAAGVAVGLAYLWRKRRARR
ncbi:MAG: DedA family protein [Deltaproteobacteria bacterium]|nr:DedA family protein [Deltaproteobacteria bacterium]